LLLLVLPDDAAAAGAAHGGPKHLLLLPSLAGVCGVLLLTTDMPLMPLELVV
jgi:hypothetical protein